MRGWPQMDCKQQLKEVELLKAAGNFNANAYLKQFNWRFREILKPKLKIAATEYVEEKIKTFKANCLQCHTPYKSNGAADDFGLCPVCEFKLTDSCFKLNLDGMYKIKSNRVFPHYLGLDLITAIQTYFISAFGRDFTFKKDAYKHINERFNLNLTEKEACAVCEINVLRRAGLIQKKIKEYVES